MRLTMKLQSALLAAGLFAMAGAASAQSNPPMQNGNYPNGSTQVSTPGYAGQTPTAQGSSSAVGNVNSPDSPQNSSSSSAPSANMMAADTRFAKEAAIGGMTEVELGKLAASKGSSDKVKQFGQKMVDDHTKAADELKSVAAKNRMTLPTSLDAKHKAMVDKMSAMSGAAFDNAYVAMMVKDHDKDVMDFKNESENGSNADIKSFATKTLPTIQEHDRMIKEIKSGMSK